MNTPTDLLREIFYLPDALGTRIEELILARGNDDLWRRIQRCLDPSMGGKTPPRAIETTISFEALQLLVETNSVELPATPVTVVNLDDALKGDRLRTRGGTVASYHGPVQSVRYPHSVEHGLGMCLTHTSEGRYRIYEQSSRDILRNLSLDERRTP